MVDEERLFVLMCVKWGRLRYANGDAEAYKWLHENGFLSYAAVIGQPSMVTLKGEEAIDIAVTEVKYRVG